MHVELAVAPPAAQQACLDAWLERHPIGARAVVAESAFAPLAAPANVALLRLTAGCVCCIGQVPLRVGLTRIVRTHRPERLLLLLASGDHVDRVRMLLTDGSLGARFSVE